MAVGMGLVAVAMVPGRHRIEVDPGLVDGRRRLEPIPFRVVAGQRTPRLHVTRRRSGYASIHRV
jgi:hypothetical protein